MEYDVIEEPATFSPAEEDNYSNGDEYPAHKHCPEDNIDNTDDFPAYPAEGADMVGGKGSVDRVEHIVLLMKTPRDDARSCATSGSSRRRADGCWLSQAGCEVV